MSAVPVVDITEARAGDLDAAAAAVGEAVRSVGFFQIVGHGVPSECIDAVYGDATRPETLEAAGVAQAESLILGSAGMANSADVIRMARSINPRLRVLARASYLRDVGALRDAGADRVYSAEGEVALAFIEDLLDSLGATPEQIDRERARAHAELFGDT